MKNVMMFSGLMVILSLIFYIIFPPKEEVKVIQKTDDYSLCEWKATLLSKEKTMSCGAGGYMHLQETDHGLLFWCSCFYPYDSLDIKDRYGNRIHGKE